MSSTRAHVHEEVLPASPERVFAFPTGFTVEPHPEGALLRVRQDGFPAGEEADGFLEACEKGWADTFAGIRRYLEASR